MKCCFIQRRIEDDVKEFLYHERPAVNEPGHAVQEAVVGIDEHVGIGLRPAGGSPSGCYGWLLRRARPAQGGTRPVE